MNGRKKITRDMIEAAEQKGWNAAQTARHYGMHRKSIESAAERFGIALPLGQSWAPPKPKPIVVWQDDIKEYTPIAPKFSVSKAAIERALTKLAAEKKSRLQATA